MDNRIEIGDMVFLAEGREGIGAVRELSDSALVIYIENAGEFHAPLSSVKSVHDKKVILNPEQLPRALLKAISHAHDLEDPKLVG